VKPNECMESKLYTLLEQAHAFLERIRIVNDVTDADAAEADKLYMDIIATKVGAAAQMARYRGDWVGAKAAFDLATNVVSMLDRLLQRIEAKRLISDLVKDLPSEDMEIMPKTRTGAIN
jgi:hypothetical protein